MAFDPDAYLGTQKSEAGGFDPDAYLGGAPKRTGAGTEFEVPTRANIAESQRRAEEGERKRVQAIREQDRGPIPGARAITGERLGRLFGPSAEALAISKGAALGAPAGPLGMLAGGTATYATLEEAKRRAKGEPTSAAKVSQDIALGGLLDVAGRKVIGPALEAAGRLSSTGLGMLRNLPELSRVQASKVAKEAVGSNMAAARESLRKAFDQDITAAQALIRVDPTTGTSTPNMPVLQSLLRNAQQRDPDFFSNLLGRQEASRFERLTQIAQGRNQTAARNARAEMKKTINEKIWPKVAQEIEAANVAGKVGPRLEAEAARFGQAAADKVEDVRRFTAAGQRAGETQVFPVPGQPRAPQRYTYMGELAQRADDVANQAAEASLRFGDAARFAQAANQSLAAHGLKPLRPEPIIESLERTLADPRVAPGNRDLQVALRRIGQELKQWTDSNGVIDAWAIDTLRKNAVNGVVQRLYPAADKQTQKQVAAKIIEQVRPVLIDAIENAGGTGYRQYLQNYALASQQIAQTKLGADALKLYLSNPTEFVKLVRGNSPEMVEKIFGPGNYNLAQQMSRDLYSQLRGVAREVQRDAAAAAQATQGEAAFHELLKNHAVSLQLPNWLNPVITTTNRVLKFLNNKWGQDTMGVLTEASRSARSFDELLTYLPPSERSKVLQSLRDPSFFREMTLPAYAGASTEGLRTNQLGGVTDMSFPLSESLLAQ